MKRVIAVVAISLLLLLAACGTKTTGKRVAIPETHAQVKAPSGITGAATVADTGETGKTAAEMLKELQENPTATTEGAKSGTFYPPITTTATGEDALKEKTRALMTQGTYDPNVEADDEFGSRYHDNSGDLTNLPDKYEDSGDQ